MGSKSKAPGHKSHVKRKRSASHTPDKGTYVQREHKDRLFRFIFRDREKQKAYGKLQASARLFAVCSQDTRKTGRGISSG